ncbi:MAG: EF-hand domain-containing protein [Phycisphaerales bacterium]|nr:MAG: EF-hand domain-containing protein [Phycisphaerales bacterium]
MNVRAVQADVSPFRRWVIALLVAAAACGGGSASEAATEPPPEDPGSPPVSFASPTEAYCPGSGNCCAANGTPGCSNFACCDWVCFLQPDCCENAWNLDCVETALNHCEYDACVDGPCPGSGDCCRPNATAGCDDGPCCHDVCTYDPFCCGGQWDAECADLAWIVCVDLCDQTPCAGRGGCCAANSTASCNNESCCQAVCAEHPSCCDSVWDGLCATEAVTLCPGICGSGHAGCPGSGGCCSSDTSPGCDDESCCNMVCANDPFCCSVGWDSLCAANAIDLCVACNPLDCPGEGGPCCEVDGTPGCDDPDCCMTVCLDDPFCCGYDTGWDDICAGSARTLCGNYCGCLSPGDFDRSNAVNLADLHVFLACFGLSSAGPLLGDCTCADLDKNRRVDLADFADFYPLLSAN